MSTSRSALELLREEPTLVGAVLHLVANGVLRSASDYPGLPLDLVARFTGLSVDELRTSGRGPVVTRRGEGCLGGAVEGEFVTTADLSEWLWTISFDSSDFAPAVPRALPGGRA